MALSVTKFEDAFDYKVIQESACDNAAIVNVTNSPGMIHSIFLDNTSNQSDAYFKFFDSQTVGMGSTVADMVFKVKAQSTSAVQIPKGLSFTHLSFACTANHNPASNNAPGAPLTVSIVVS